MTDRTSTPNPRPTVRLLSLSAGVQRTTVLLLSCNGMIRRFGYTLFTESPRTPTSRRKTSASHHPASANHNSDNQQPELAPDTPTVGPNSPEATTSDSRRCRRDVRRAQGAFRHPLRRGI